MLHRIHIILQLLYLQITTIIKIPIHLFLSLQIHLGIIFTLKVRNFWFNGVQVPIYIFITPHATKIHIPPCLIQSKPDSLANKCKIMVIFTCICVSSTNSSKSNLAFRTALRTIFPQWPAPLLCCFIEFTSSFISLYVLDKSSSCWPSAHNWKAMLAFCVVDSLFSEILCISKIWLVVQNISSHKNQSFSL